MSRFKTTEPNLFFEISIRNCKWPTSETFTENGIDIRINGCEECIRIYKNRIRMKGSRRRILFYIDELKKHNRVCLNPGKA